MGAMCLLAVAHRLHPDYPLVVAANRDEMLERPATPLGVFRESAPRILAGTDERAGGTWLAISERGVVAGLTNKPTPGVERDPTLKSRGQLPVLLAQEETATSAVERFIESVRCEEYSPCWMFVADGSTLHYLDVTGKGAPRAEHLDPGLHILENRPLHARSPKADWVRAQLSDLERWPADELPERLAAVLRSHVIPPGVEDQSLQELDGFFRPAQTEAACVHAGPYGTRSATIVLASEHPPPQVRAADGPLCTHPLEQRTHLWTS